MPRLLLWLKNGRRALLAIAFVCLIVCVYLVVYHSGGIETLVAQDMRLRRWVEARPLQAFAAGLAIYTAASFVPGTTGKAIAVGWLYGFWQGVLLVEVALCTAAVCSFLFSRYLLRESIRSRYAIFLERLDTNLLRRPGLYVLMLRLAHVPYTALNYILGATGIPVRTFLWTTALGLLPGTVVFVFAGRRLPTLAELVDQGAWGLLDPWLIGALVASALSVPLGHLLAGWFKQRFSATSGSLQQTDG
jgi:uncharacterized membrane protein YdjX (TVP38/TMEM64 family)